MLILGGGTLFPPCCTSPIRSSSATGMPPVWAVGRRMLTIICHNFRMRSGGIQTLVEMALTTGC
jgi:hypothetical protein